MSTFTVEATLIHPEHRERAVTAAFLVDTGAFYSLAEIEDLFARAVLMVPDDAHSQRERHLLAIGKATSGGACSLPSRSGRRAGGG